MKILQILILLVLGNAGIILAADGQEAPITLEAAKEQGRIKSRFLKETKDAAKATDAIPKANVAYFQESVGPILNKELPGLSWSRKVRGQTSHRPTES